MDLASSADLPSPIPAQEFDQNAPATPDAILSQTGNSPGSAPPPSQPVTKRRWRRNQVACDACHARRVRCDRAFPCSRCLRSDINCEFTRERRKRGRVARPRPPPSADIITNGHIETARGPEPRKRSSEGATATSNHTDATNDANAAAPVRSRPAVPDHNQLNNHHQREYYLPPPLHCPSLSQHDPAGPAETAASLPRLESPTSFFHRRSPATMLSAHSLDDRTYPSRLQDLSTATRRATIGGNVTEEWLAASHLSPESYDILGGAGWNDGPLPRPLEPMGSPDIARRHSSVQRAGSISAIGALPPGVERHGSGAGQTPLKYPVLQPLMPFLETYLPPRLVFDLLELYFTSAFSTHMHPVCHHIHCYVLRKASFLRRDAPRRSSPALLASMLWVAALDDRAFALSISPLQRRKVCQFLCALTIRLLRPLIHVSFQGPEGVGEAGYASPAAGHDFSFSTSATMQPAFEAGGGDDRGLVGPAGSLDDIITYIHVASIISASEQKAASMRWWHAAFTLARELKLNQEIEVVLKTNVPVDESSPGFDYAMWTGDGRNQNSHLDDFSPPRPSLNCVCDQAPASGSTITEEHREERRRTWWLLYIMDRHLALCYNRPLALLDAESEDLLLPLDESSWQAGNVHSNSPKPDGPQCRVSGERNKRRVFPNFICHDHSIFGFFLPLMTITGELIDLNQVRNHPMLGLRLQGKEAWDRHVNEVLRQLEVYKASMTTFATHAADVDPLRVSGAQSFAPDKTTGHHPTAATTGIHLPSLATVGNGGNGGGSTGTTLPAPQSWHTQTVMAYASYLVHVLHILLVGKWDPVSLIEDKDFWTSSPAFASTISHALDAADSVDQILRFDPDVSFMPYFFGIQLLQGSFLLLLIVERLQKEAGEGILNACEVMIRATESCVVTLNTEYQRNFRQVMRSAVAQARGRPVNHSEIRHRRKAILALYRWTRKGTGLAL